MKKNYFLNRIESIEELLLKNKLSGFIKQKNIASALRVYDSGRLLIFFLGSAIVILLIVMFFKSFENSNDDITIENTSSKAESIIKENETYFVYVSGAVQTPGVYSLKKDSRIIDAINKAGGLREDADSSSINLAAPIEDAQHIIVSSKNSDPDISSGTYDGTKSTTSKININNASISQLMTISGIGQATAEKIVEYRKNNGSFKSIEDIKNVSGIGDKKYESIKDFICI